LGHLTAAYLFNWKISSIEIAPFGGMLKTDDWSTALAREEIIVVLAGPLYNVCLGFFLHLIFCAGIWTGQWHYYFLFCNLIIACFNMLPIYPLDGGRLLQALLSYYVPYDKCLFITQLFSLFSATGLFVASFLLPASGIHLPIAICASFLFFLNYQALRNRQYLYLRFLLARMRKGVNYNQPISPKIIDQSKPLYVAMSQWYKERYNIITVTNEQGYAIGVLPEKTLLQLFFSNKDHSLTLGALLTKD
jgi:stage IV sporulation protein FB